MLFKLIQVAVHHVKDLTVNINNLKLTNLVDSEKLHATTLFLLKL